MEQNNASTGHSKPSKWVELPEEIIAQIKEWAVAREISEGEWWWDAVLSRLEDFEDLEDAEKRRSEEYKEGDSMPLEEFLKSLGEEK